MLSTFINHYQIYINVINQPKMVEQYKRDSFEYFNLKRSKKGFNLCNKLDLQYQECMKIEILKRYIIQILDSLSLAVVVTILGDARLFHVYAWCYILIYLRIQWFGLDPDVGNLIITILKGNRVGKDIVIPTLGFAFLDYMYIQSSSMQFFVMIG